MREDALLHPGQPDRVELEALRGVQRHQRDAVSSFGGVRVAHQRELLEESEQRRVGRALLELRRGGGERREQVRAISGLAVGEAATKGPGR